VKLKFARLSFRASTTSACAIRFRSAWLCLAALAFLSPRRLHAEELAPERDRVQQVVDDSRARLGIPQEVRVSIVAANTLVVSVQPHAVQPGVFLLSFEQGFLQQLSDDEIAAVVAHELGHVWIFTHHPYLQTEQLANQIAMRLVARETLEPIYDKLWKRLGVTGDLATYLGSRPAALH
jgi:hypothetical protein